MSQGTSYTRRKPLLRNCIREKGAVCHVTLVLSFGQPLPTWRRRDMDFEAEEDTNQVWQKICSITY